MIESFKPRHEDDDFDKLKANILKKLSGFAQAAEQQ